MTSTSVHTPRTEGLDVVPSTPSRVARASSNTKRAYHLWKPENQPCDRDARVFIETCPFATKKDTKLPSDALLNIA
jgi:hypothetical protein